MLLTKRNFSKATANCTTLAGSKDAGMSSVVVLVIIIFCNKKKLNIEKGDSFLDSLLACGEVKKKW